MQRLGGCCQRGIRRALWARGTASTADILAWAYPWGSKTRRQRQNRATAVRRAARRMAVKVGRTWPDGTLWRLKDMD
jgi:hypothetical protein